MLASMFKYLPTLKKLKNYEIFVGAHGDRVWQFRVAIPKAEVSHEIAGGRFECFFLKCYMPVPAHFYRQMKKTTRHSSKVFGVSE